MPWIFPKKTINLPPEFLDKLVGKYKSKELDIVVPVFREGGKLYTRTSFWDKVELIPENETQFFGDSKNIGNLQVNFVRDKEGEVKHVITYLGFRGIKFDKIK